MVKKSIAGGTGAGLLIAIGGMLVQYKFNVVERLLSWGEKHNIKLRRNEIDDLVDDIKEAANDTVENVKEATEKVAEQV